MNNISLNKFASMQASIGYVKVIPTMQLCWTGISMSTHFLSISYAIIDWRCLRISTMCWWIPKYWILCYFKTTFFGKSLLFNFVASITDRVCGISFNSKSAEPTDGLSHKDEFQFKRLLKMIAWFASRPASPWTMGCDKSVFKDSLKPTFKLCVMHNNDNSSTLILGKSLTR